MKYKALFLDIDDTLIGDDKRISQRNLAAIRAAQRSGVYVSVATGRGYKGSRRIWAEIGTRGPVVVYGGALIKDTENDATLYSADIDAALIQEVLEFAAGCGLHAQIYQGDKVIYEKDNAFVQRYVQVLELPHELDPEIRKKEWLHVPKVLVFSPPEREKEMRELFTERFPGRLEVASSKPGFIEINRLGSHKGEAVRIAAEKMGWGIEQVIAIGDNTLDKQMIAMAGLGVCVENGQPEIKDIADVIAPACKEDGVAWVIEQFLLQGGY